MNNSSVLLVVFSGLTFSVNSHPVGIDLVSTISVVDDEEIGPQTVHGIDVVKDETLVPEYLRRNWCSIVNSYLGRRLGVINRYVERIPPGRGWTYKVELQGTPAFVYGFVCPGDPKCFLVVVREFPPVMTDVKLHGYTLQQTNSTIVTNLGETNERHAGVYMLRAV